MLKTITKLLLVRNPTEKVAALKYVSPVHHQKIAYLYVQDRRIITGPETSEEWIKIYFWFLLKLVLLLVYVGSN